MRRLSRARSLATALALLDDDQYLAPSRALQVVLPTRGLAWKRSRDFDSRSTAGLDLTAPVVAFDISRIRESRPH